MYTKNLSQDTPWIKIFHKKVAKIKIKEAFVQFPTLSKLFRESASDHQFRPANSQGRLPNSFDYVPILVT